MFRSFCVIIGVSSSSSGLLAAGTTIFGIRTLANTTVNAQSVGEPSELKIRIARAC